MTEFGAWYETPLVDGRIGLRRVVGPLPPLRIEDGELVGQRSRVSSRGVLVRSGRDGELTGVPVPVPTAGELCADPSDGGVRTRDNRLAAGGDNMAVTQATWFGMVNAFVHSERMLLHLDRLLIGLGAAPLPVLPVLVGAHAGSRLPGYGQGDGDFRSGRMRPLSGGHYRLSRRTSVVPELHPVSPTGEVHLGPGRLAQSFAGRPSYLRSAAHNPATIYHEIGHHLCRHTADLRLNAERRPEEQRNGKSALDEGVADYLAASRLGTGRPYGWYHAARGLARDPGEPGDRHLDDDDPHAAGAWWAALLWQGRTDLLQEQQIERATDHERVVLATLLAIGAVGRDAGRGPRPHRERELSTTGLVVNWYLATAEGLLGRRAAATLRIGVERGLADAARVDATAPC